MFSIYSVNWKLKLYINFIIPHKFKKINIIVIKSTFNITFGIKCGILPLKLKIPQNTYNKNYAVHKICFLKAKKA